MGTAGLIDPDADRDEIARTLLEIRGADEVERLAAHSGGGRPPEAIIAGGVAVTRARFEELQMDAERRVIEHHEQHPLRPGMPVATLATGLGASPDLAGMVVDASTLLQRNGPDVSSTRHRPALDEEAEEAWGEAESILKQGLAVPSADELGMSRDLLHRMAREGRVVRVSDDFVFLPEQIEEIKGHLAEMDSPFTVAQFRDQSGLSRKYAVPILEWADREGLTIRRGDERHLR
jgi:selenocysteine-specific elongation factor